MIRSIQWQVTLPYNGTFLQYSPGLWNIFCVQHTFQYVAHDIKCPHFWLNNLKIGCLSFEFFSVQHPSAHRVPFINKPCAQDSRRLRSESSYLYSWLAKKKHKINNDNELNLYLNLFINFPPVLTLVLTGHHLSSFAAWNRRCCKENVSCTISVPQQEGQNDCQGVSLRMGW